MPNGGLQRLYGTFAQLWTRCGAEGWRRLSKCAPRPSGARRRRPVGGTSLLKVAARTPFPSAHRRESELGCGREGDRGAAAPSGQVPAALPNASSAARRSRATGRVGVCGALPVPRSGSRRPDDRLQFWGLGAVSKRLVCGSSRLRTGLPRLERLREKTEGRQRAGGTSALPKASSSALCLGRPARAAALSRAVACPKPPHFAAAARRS